MSLPDACAELLGYMDAVNNRHELINLLSLLCPLTVITVGFVVVTVAVVFVCSLVVVVFFFLGGGGVRYVLGCFCLLLLLFLQHCCLYLLWYTLNTDYHSSRPSLQLSRTNTLTLTDY